MKNKKLFYGILVIVLLILGATGIVLLTGPNGTTVNPEINSFEECVGAGYPILESYPRQCQIPDGKTFTEETPKEQPCAKNGERVNRNHLMGSTGKQCCPGLVEEKVSRSYSVCTLSIESNKEECIKAGEEMSPKEYDQGARCCSGLKRIPTSRYVYPCDTPGKLACDENGCKITPPTSFEEPSSQCTPCGNGVCETEHDENRCNCPEDCKEKCADDGERVYYKPNFGPTRCCSKNAGVKPSSFLDGSICIAPDDGSLGTCVQNWWLTCGDGECGKDEDKCSCSEDCK